MCCEVASSRVRICRLRLSLKRCAKFPSTVHSSERYALMKSEPLKSAKGQSIDALTNSRRISTTGLSARDRKKHDPKDFGSGEAGEHQSWARSPSLPENDIK